MRRAVAVGHAQVVAGLAAVLRRENHHGLSVVAACVADAEPPAEIDGIPVLSGLGGIADAVGRFGADTVAVLACG
jgi:hypothetical protein